VPRTNNLVFGSNVRAKPPRLLNSKTERLNRRWGDEGKGDGAMSDKDRQKKDHKRKDKENEAMREAQALRKQQTSSRKIKDQSDVPDSQPDIKRRSA
jgi:hypothetical protein